MKKLGKKEIGRFDKTKTGQRKCSAASGFEASPGTPQREPQAQRLRRVPEAQRLWGVPRAKRHTGSPEALTWSHPNGKPKPWDPQSDPSAHFLSMPNLAFFPKPFD